MTKGKDQVTDAQIQHYYNKNKAQFAHAREARRAHRADQDRGQRRRRPRRRSSRGQSWSAVAKKYSTDPATQGQRRRCSPASPRASRRRRSTRRSSRPRRASSSGPVKTQFGYYVFERAEDHAGHAAVARAVQDDDQPTSSSRQNQQKALTDFGKDYRNRWKDATDCRKGYVTARLQERARRRSPRRRRPRPARSSRRRARAPASTQK